MKSVNIKKAIIVSIIIVIIFAVGFYFYFFQNTLSEANDLYAKGKYIEAYESIKSFLVFGNSDVEKIRFSNDIMQDYIFYELNVNVSGNSKDYQSAFHWLLYGLSVCVNESDPKFHKANTETKKSVLTDVAEIYSRELTDVFNLSKDEAVELCKLSCDEWDKIYQELSSTNRINKK